MSKDKNKPSAKKNRNRKNGEQDRRGESRATLPIPDMPPVTPTAFDAKDTGARRPTIRPPRQPDGAPNALMAPVDDGSGGASSVFIGPCHTPNFKNLAANRLRYDRFHTTALCPPPRAASLPERRRQSVRPELIKGERQSLFSGTGRLTEASVINIKNKSHSVTAEVEVPDSGAEGVIIAQGGVTGGWSLYAKDGKPKYCYNFYGLDLYYVEGKDKIPAGKRQVRMEFAYDGGGLAKGGTVTLFVDGKKTGEGRVAQTEPLAFSADETCDVGDEAGSPVTTDYKTRKFSGEINWVQIDLGNDAKDADQLIRPEERLRVATATR